MLPSAARPSSFRAGASAAMALAPEDVLEVRGDAVQGQALEVELQAARQDGHRQLLRVGGGEQELHVRRRLLQGLQQGVEAVVGEHVHFVDEVDLVAAAAGRVLHVLQQLAGLVHLGARGGVHLDQVHEAAGVDLGAGGADAAGLGGDALVAVEGLGQDAGDGGLAHAAGAGEQVGVVQAVVVQGVHQGAQHVLLPHHFMEIARAPLARQYLVTHRRLLSNRPDRPLPSG
jgi:hypothetical protein